MKFLLVQSQIAVKSLTRTSDVMKLTKKKATRITLIDCLIYIELIYFFGKETHK